MASVEEALAPLQGHRFLRLACIASRGDPLVAPVRFVVEGSALYFPMASDLPLVVHLVANRRVALEGDEGGEGRPTGLMIHGLAQRVRGRGERERVGKALAAKYPEWPPAEEDLLFQVVPVRFLDLDGRERSSPTNP